MKSLGTGMLRFNDLPVRDVIRIFAGFGLNFFEVKTQDLGEQDAQELADLKKEFGLKYAVHMPHALTVGLPTSLCATNKEEILRAMNWLHRSVQAAEKVQAEYVALHPDFANFGEKKYAHSREAAYDQLVQNLAGMKSKVPLAVENMPYSDFFCAEPNELLRLSENVSGLKFIFNTSHAWHAVKGDMQAVLDFYSALEPNVVAVNVSDCDADHAHLPIGEGAINWNDFFNLPKVKEKHLVLKVQPKRDITEVIGSFNKVQDFLSEKALTSG